MVSPTATFKVLGVKLMPPKLMICVLENAGTEIVTITAAKKIVNFKEKKLATFIYFFMVV